MKEIKKIQHSSLGELSFGILEESTDTGIMEAVSRLLISCASNLSEEKGGHVPDFIVQNRILKHYTTPQSVAALAKGPASRFVLMNTDRQILATGLVANNSGMLMPEETHGIHDVANLKKNERIKPYHSVFNVAVDLGHRRKGLASILIDNICAQEYKQFSGTGLYLRSEPPEHVIWSQIGFTHVPETDEFFADAVPLPKGLSKPEEYNSLYSCSCAKPEGWDIHNQDKKLKYFGFVRQFAAS